MIDQILGTMKAINYKDPSELPRDHSHLSRMNIKAHSDDGFKQSEPALYQPLQEKDK